MYTRRNFRAGETLGASDLNELANEVVRQGKISALPPLQVTNDSSGIAFSINIPQAFWIRLLSGGPGGLYAWERVDATSGGGWATSLGNQNGTTSNNPATEVNGNTSVDLSPNPVVRAWIEPTSNTVVFQSGTC